MRLPRQNVAPAGSYADAWGPLLSDGWTGVLPLLDGTKGPPPSGYTGGAGIDTSAADCQAWAEGDAVRAGKHSWRAGRQLALRMPRGVVGIDVDHYGDKRGADTLDELIDQLGPLPVAPITGAREDGNPSGIRLFRVDDDVVLRGGAAVEELGLTGIDVVQRHHRYALAWPSVHPETGAPYTWRGTAGPALAPAVDDLPRLPDAWVEYLRDESGRGDSSAEATPVQVREFEASAVGNARPHGVRGLAGVFLRERGRSGARHDALVATMCMAAREAGAGHYPATAGRQAVEEAFLAALQGDRAGMAGRESAAAWAWAVGQVAALDEVECEALCASSSRRELNGSRKVGNGASTPHVPAGDKGAEEINPLGSWASKDLTAAVNGTKVRAVPSMGVKRVDGVQFLYPGKEHSCFGETESGKSWFALACVAAELAEERRVLYVHFEEDDETDTVERLMLLGVSGSRIIAGLDFVGPASPITQAVIDHYEQDPPALVVLDGQNEAMALHGQGIREEDGAAAFRARLVKPFAAMGAAVLALDHVVKSAEAKGQGYALGSVHKVNGLSGAAFLLENEEPFGIGRRGASLVYVVKDRPGMVRRHGQPTGVARKFKVGVMSVDATHAGTAVLDVWAPKERVEDEQRDDLAERALAVVVDLSEVEGDDVARSEVFDRLEARRQDKIHAVDELVKAGRLQRSTGQRGAQLLRLPTRSQDQMP